MGAPQTRLFELCQGLKKRGWNVEVITAMPNYPQGKISPGYKWKIYWKEELQGILLHRYWLFASNSLKAFPRIISMLSFSLMALFSLPRILRFRPQFLMVESPPLTLGISAWLLSVFSKTKMVFNVSDIWPRTAKELGAISENRFYRFLERMERFLYRKAFVCTGQSEEIVRHLEEKGAKQVLLFRNGVDLTRFSDLNGFNPVRQNPDKQHLKLVYTGLLGVAQGILRICEQVDFKALNAELHIYGAGPEKEQLERFLEKNPNANVFYHGIIESAEIPKVLRSADAALISLVTNIYGAVPSKIYEAMAAGKPILFSGEGEGARIIQKNQAGWVNSPKDLCKLEENIRAMQLSPEKVKQLSENSRLAAESQFNREFQFDKLHSFLSAELQENG
ncbi:MAG: glycosyltransferase family 4 protein [Saprospiraceae bacterium]|nr:glycosyltransferase family 4 protein [Lewinellaceae bacterium]